MTIKKNKETQEVTPQPLTLASLYELDKKNDETETKSFADGRLTLKLNKVFRPTIIQKMFNDAYKAFGTIQREKVTMEDVQDRAFIIAMCTFKYFTDLPLGHLNMSKKKDVEKLIAVGRTLFDNEIFEEIYRSFDPAQIAKIDRIQKESQIMKNQMGELFTQLALQEIEESNKKLSESEIEDGLHQSE